MVKLREEQIGGITELDEDGTGIVTASSAEMQDVSGVVHDAITTQPTTGVSVGAFWVEDVSPTLPKFTDSDGNTITLGQGGGLEQVQTTLPVTINGQSSFTLPIAPEEDGYVLMFRNGVKKTYGDDYTTSGVSVTYSDTDLLTSDTVEFFYIVDGSGGSGGGSSNPSQGNNSINTSDGYGGWNDSDWEIFGSVLNYGAGDAALITVQNNITIGSFTGSVTLGATTDAVVDGNNSVQIKTNGNTDIWPSLQASGVLTNNGSGVLTWETAGSGGGSLSETLAIGNTTDGYDILLSTSDILTMETPGDTMNIVTPENGASNSGSIFLNTGGGTTNNSGSIQLRSGDSANSSGIMQFYSGTVSGSGSTGDLFIFSGQNTGTGDSGGVRHTTGATTSGDAGGFDFFGGSATSGNTGDFAVVTGDSTDGDTGSINFNCGNTTNGSGGSSLIHAGDGNQGGFAGLLAGNSSGTDLAGGSISFYAGTGNGVPATPLISGRGGGSVVGGSGNGSGGNSAGGLMHYYTGTGVGTGWGGTMLLNTGDGGTTGDGGDFDIRSGSSGASGGRGGNFAVQLGSGSTVGGAFSVETGDAETGSGSNGGDFTVNTGAGDGAGDAGDIFLRRNGNTVFDATENRVSLYNESNSQVFLSSATWGYTQVRGPTGTNVFDSYNSGGTTYTAISNPSGSWVFHADEANNITRIMNGTGLYSLVLDFGTDIGGASNGDVLVKDPGGSGALRYVDPSTIVPSSNPTYTPSNFTPTGPDIDGYFEGVDDAFGSVPSLDGYWVSDDGYTRIDTPVADDRQESLSVADLGSDTFTYPIIENNRWFTITWRVRTVISGVRYPADIIVIYERDGSGTIRVVDSKELFTPPAGVTISTGFGAGTGDITVNNNTGGAIDIYATPVVDSEDIS